MKRTVILILGLVALLVIGCGTPDPEAPNTPPKRMPGGPGVTAGQTGTGTTSGASTGY